MRNLKLASASLLLVLGGGLTIACGDSGDDGADGGGVGASNTGGGATTGGAGNTGGGATTGGAGTGGGATAGCDSTTKATGTPTMIDDFNTAPETPGMIPENDGRAGQWAHGHFLNAAGSLPEFVSEGGGEGGGPGYMQITCESGNADDFPQCNTAWDSEAPWAQWASVSTLLQTYSDPLSCYDVDGVFTGLKFKAKSTSGSDKIRIQIATPDANSDTGETYQSPEISLTNAWADYEIPFANIEQPSWSTVTAPLNLAALQSIAFVVRTRTDQEEGGMVVGEKLEAYQIQFDDIEFY